MGVAPKVIYVKHNSVEPEFYTFVDAVYNNFYEKAEEMLKVYPDFINTIITPTNQSPLSSVLSKKTIDYTMLNILVKHGVEFTYPINTMGDFALDLACRTRDLQLISYLVAHDVSISEAAIHKLLFKAKDIKTLNTKDIKMLLSIIHQLGGLAEVGEMIDDQGRTFKAKAERINLSNDSYGTLRYNLWNLLNLAENQEPDKAERNDANKILDEELALITHRYYEKENTDFSLGNSITSLFGAGGMPIEFPDDSVYEYQQKPLNQK
ncbi:hypothetical protein DGG96_18875 [Legionella qingyii]|uniref:Uncharacterized protein n=2 Tax=Legionella qingyii TaxID=2184757 RepID=A0A317U026_9GAMM|nr:Dot/Icm T4SS effector AnkJ/LegA11 [Legionella qingyii]PWY54066.1 hypothetical protein DGG96_18875 [Legionella qingyii]RUR19898.1 hypothetical protein ELY20_15380 [Legionella qingyii]RUR22371.1 hypothetical protein ELY16_15090 [Legionella qingyii]